MLKDRRAAVRRGRALAVWMRARVRGAAERLCAQRCDAVLAIRCWSVLVLLGLIVGLNVYLYSACIPKGFFPQQDTGGVIGGIRADQSDLVPGDAQKFAPVQGIVQRGSGRRRSSASRASPAGCATNSGFLFIALKPLGERKRSAEQVVARLRPKLAQVAGAQLFLQAVQDIRVGGRQAAAQYQFTLQGDDAGAIYSLGPSWSRSCASTRGHSPTSTPTSSSTACRSM